MIEAAKVVVPIGHGKEVETRAIAARLQALTDELTFLAPHCVGKVWCLSGHLRKLFMCDKQRL
jgi:hypothetical protein